MSAKSGDRLTLVLNVNGRTTVDCVAFDKASRKTLAHLEASYLRLLQAHARALLEEATNSRKPVQESSHARKRVSSALPGVATSTRLVLFPMIIIS